MSSQTSGSSWFDAVVAAPHDAWVFLENSDNPLFQYIFALISSQQAQALWAKVEVLFANYGRFIIPFIGIFFQIWMSSKARAWAERRHNENDRVAASRRQADAIWADETRRAEQAGKGPEAASSSSSAPATKTTATKPSSGTSTPNKRKGRK
ncbi:hypothetical protein OIV83_004934 [Microbotryomycetes sp. JL201]|nr:hypothetical protein OIV83_004934 [Microbotryomycetes sp. JL201]